MSKGRNNGNRDRANFKERTNHPKQTFVQRLRSAGTGQKRTFPHHHQVFDPHPFIGAGQAGLELATSDPS